MAPLLAAWGAGTAASLLRGQAGTRLAAWGLAVLVVAAAVPGRVSWQQRSVRSASVLEEATQELQGQAGTTALWLSDTPLRGDGGEGLESRGFILPRDSRFPGRYDFAYWPRWYAGFDWVLLSAARVRENMTRGNADAPRHFYQAVEAQGRLVREWGDADRGDGYRLYRIPPDSPWHQPLTETELAALHGGPQQTWFLGNLAALYAATGDLKTSALLLRQGIDWDPRGLSLYNNLGGIYLREGEFEAAAGVFDRGLRIDPGSFELLFNYAQAAADRGLLDRAERLLRRALTVRPEEPRVHYALGRVFLAEGKEEQARMALTRYLELDPGSPRRAQVEAVLSELAAAPADSAAAPAAPGNGTP